MKSRVFLMVCLITLVFSLGALWAIRDELPTIAHAVLYSVAGISVLGALFAIWRLYLEVRKHALLVKEHKQRIAHEQRRLSMEEERHQQEHEATLHTAKLALL